MTATPIEWRFWTRAVALCRSMAPAVALSFTISVAAHGVAGTLDRVSPEAVAELKQRAEQALSAGPFSVMDKEAVAPSGNKHDYFSLSPYHWPNPNTPDGLPYVFRDGEVNPEARGSSYDRDRYGQMTDCVMALALAYRHCGEDRFAARAAFLMRTWFLDPATRMTPHLEYAQHAKGCERQPPWGIIRGRALVDLGEATEWLRKSDAWTDADEGAWVKWLSAYLDWLLHSDKGREESRAVNNHGTWYDVQAASLALRCGNVTVARKTLVAVGDRRIAKHIAPSGRQTFEMLRTKSWDYSVMNLRGLFELAYLAERVELDLWHYSTKDGRCLRGAFEFLLPFAAGEQPWPAKQIGEWRPADLYPVARRASVKYGRGDYVEKLRHVPGIDEAATRDLLRYPTLD